MRILLIEDEIHIAQFIKKNLEREFFAVDVAEDGEKGSAWARINEYDLIILDLVIPKKSGQDVIKEIREKQKTMPILVLTVRSETISKVSILDAGADDYLTKPFSLSELLARIRALLRRPKIIENEVYEIDDLIMDSKRKSVKRGHKDIYLNRKEFMLLEYMLRNRGLVLSQGMILEHVWDMHADAFSNTIEVHILRLRKKIDTSKKRKLIHTLPGRGYKIDC